MPIKIDSIEADCAVIRMGLSGPEGDLQAIYTPLSGIRDMKVSKPATLFSGCSMDIEVSLYTKNFPIPVVATGKGALAYTEALEGASFSNVMERIFFILDKNGADYTNPLLKLEHGLSEMTADQHAGVVFLSAADDNSKIDVLPHLLKAYLAQFAEIIKKRPEVVPERVHWNADKSVVEFDVTGARHYTARAALLDDAEQPKTELAQVLHIIEGGKRDLPKPSAR